MSGINYKIQNFPLMTERKILIALQIHPYSNAYHKTNVRQKCNLFINMQTNVFVNTDNDCTIGTKCEEC